MCGTKPYDPAKQLCDFRDMQLYRIVIIGEQTWMAENLNYKTENSLCGGGSAKNEGDCSKYGRLYIWADANDACPEGWHLPDTTDWKTLFDAVGGIDVAGKILKSQTGWEDSDDTSGNGTDSLGFSAIPAGYRHFYGYFSRVGSHTYFWSATEEHNSFYVYIMYLSYDFEDAFLSTDSKDYAFSVRCLKD